MSSEEMLKNQYPDAFRDLQKQEYGFVTESTRKTYLFCYNLFMFCGFLFIFAISNIRYVCTKILYRSFSKSLKNKKLYHPSRLILLFWIFKVRCYGWRICFKIVEIGWSYNQITPPIRKFYMIINLLYPEIALRLHESFAIYFLTFSDVSWSPSSNLWLHKRNLS